MSARTRDRLDTARLGAAVAALNRSTRREIRLPLGASTIAALVTVEAEGPIRATFEAQAKKWGGPLLNHLVYARRPTIFRGARAMWTGLDASGLIDGRLAALINRRVASLNHCAF